MKKAMKGFSMVAGAVKVPRGSVSNMVQKRVEASVGNCPLSHGESRGIEGIPNYFISTVEHHHNRPYVASTKVSGEIVYIHEVPQVGASCGPIWLPRRSKNCETPHV